MCPKWRMQGRRCEKDCLKERQDYTQSLRNHLTEVNSLSASILRWQVSSPSASGNNIELDIEKQTREESRQDGERHKCI